MMCSEHNEFSSSYLIYEDYCVFSTVDLNNTSQLTILISSLEKNVIYWIIITDRVL